MECFFELCTHIAFCYKRSVFVQRQRFFCSTWSNLYLTIYHRLLNLVIYVSYNLPKFVLKSILIYLVSKKRMDKTKFKHIAVNKVVNNTKEK